MKADKQKKLGKAGWRTGSVADFLGLTPTEEAYIEMKLALMSRFAVRSLPTANVVRLPANSARLSKLD